MTARQEIERYVSRETLDALRHYESQIAKWTRSVSLISKRDESAIWERHILDSLQIWPLVAAHSHIVDFGSGGGLPGLVIAICQRNAGSGKITLVESDQRKCAFLRTITAELALPATTIASRLEAAPPQIADVSTARALAPVADLLKYTLRHTKQPHQALFHKGKQAAEELKAASVDWHFSVQRHPSKTSAEGVILHLTDIRPKRGFRG